METDLEEQDFDRRVAEKRHKAFMESQQKFLDKQEQITATLKGVTNAINKNADNKEIVKLIDQYTKEIGNFRKDLQAIKFDIPAPTVHVETNQDKVVLKLQALEQKMETLNKSILRTNELLEKISEPKDYDFEFQRNQWGAMQSPIKAKQVRFKK